MFKVLVIDSSAEDAESLRGLLAEEGAQVVVCRDGAAAIPVIEGHAVGFTAVVAWPLKSLTPRRANLLVEGYMSRTPGE